MCGKIMMDRVKNEDIRSLVGVAPIEDKIRKNRLRWFGHVGRRPIDAPVRMVEKIDIEQGKKLRGIPKMTWLEVVTKYMKLLELEERMVAGLKKKDPCNGSNINFLSVLVHIADPILLGLRLVGLVWFGNL